MEDTKYLFDEGQPTRGMVSVSQLQTFMSCKTKWAYNYIENLTPRVERSYLTIGKLCHRGMQIAMQMLWKHPDIATLENLTDAGLHAMEVMGADYMEITPMLNEEIPEFEQMLKDANEIFTQALEEFDPMKYEVVTVVKNGERTPALELHFKVPCPPAEGLHGYIDAILRDKETGYVWCTDYKFRKSLSPDDDEAYNVQNAVYSYACDKMGINITGTMTWQHLNTPASDPKINKDGTISTAKIKTTWNHYAKFCEEHGQDPQDYYLDMVDKLKDIEWYRATLEYRNEDTVNRIWEQCIEPATNEVVLASNGDSEIYRSMYPWNCKMCQYQSLCQAELRDYDADAIREREYVKREYIRNASPLPVVESETA